MNDKITISTAQPAEYRTLPEWPAYRFGSDGSVWTICTRRGRQRAIGKQLRASRNPDGYRVVRLYDTQKPHRTKKVSVLVCTAFHGPAPVGYHCRHLNGVRTDDRAENLAWGSAQDNERDKIGHGTILRGEKNPRARLTDAQVSEIRSLRGTLYQREIAARFGITPQYVCYILSGRYRADEA